MPTVANSSAPGAPPISPRSRDQERDHSADESWSGPESDNAAHHDASHSLKRKRPQTVSYVLSTLYGLASCRSPFRLLFR